jgi:hypothetical protein
MLTADLISNNVDVACVQETKLGGLNATIQAHVEGYVALRADRDCNGGGVLLLIRSTLTYYPLTKVVSTKALEAVAVVVLGSDGKKTVVVSVYRPPSRSVQLIDRFVNDMSTLLDVVKVVEPHAQVVIAGDININSLVPADCAIIDPITDGYGLTQHIREVTHHKSCIDHLWTSDNLTVECKLGPTLERKKKSDAGHATIIAKVRSAGIVARPPQEVRTRQMWHNANWAGIAQYLTDKKLLEVVSGADGVEEALSNFNNICIEAIERHVPVKTSKKKCGRHARWWNRDILPLLRRRDQLYRQMKANPEVEHMRHLFQNARKTAREALAKAKKEFPFHSICLFFIANKISNAT